MIGLGISCFLPLPAITPAAIAAIAALGLVQVGVSSVLFAYGIKRVSAVSANLIAVIEPVFNPVWVFLIIGELPSANAIIGGLMIIAAVTVSSVIGARRAATAPATA